MQRKPRLLVGRVLSVVDSIRASYWFLPMLMAVGAGVTAVLLVDLDRGLSSSAIERIPWIAKTEPDGTRAVLTAIAGSMITVTGVVFSITIVALTLASSQFGPRLLRNFLRDRANQFAFGTFVATFLYSLIVLRSVRAENVPLVASAVAVALAGASVFVLIFFIHHIAVSLQATSVIASVANEIDAQMQQLFPEALGGEQQQTPDAAIDELRTSLQADGRDVTAAENGYIRVVDDRALETLSAEEDLMLVLRHRPGDFVYAGTTLARVGPAGRVDDRILERVRRTFILGPHRTAVQDLQFLTSQLTEIAARALSPGVNNPHTAIDCIQRLGAVVCAAAGRAMPSAARLDDSGRLRIVAPATTFPDIVAGCFDEVRRFGSGQPSVAIAMLDALSRAGECSRDEDRLALVAEHTQGIAAAFNRSEAAASVRDREMVQRALDAALQQLESHGRRGVALGAS